MGNDKLEGSPDEKVFIYAFWPITAQSEMASPHAGKQIRRLEYESEYCILGLTMLLKRHARSILRSITVRPDKFGV